MKTAITIVMTLALVTVSGCHTNSPRGGGMTKDVGFKVAVPNRDTDVKQGEVRAVTVSLQRGKSFKQDVKLQVRASKGISVEPTSVTVKAGDKPDVQLQIAAAKDAALSEYPVVVRGTPETGEQTSVGFTVKVIAP